MTVVCPHTAISARRSARLMGRMGPGIKLGYNRGTARKTIVYYAYKLMGRFAHLLHRGGGAGALPTAFSVPSFLQLIKGVEELGVTGISQ